MPRPKKIPKTVKYKYLLGIINKENMYKILRELDYADGQALFTIRMLDIKRYLITEEEK